MKEEYYEVKDYPIAIKK